MTFKNQIPEDQRITLRNHYHKMLFKDIVPWWEKNSIDKELGGYFTRLKRDGKPYSYDKDMWMTGREIWMFSHLYNNYENKDEWKKIAKHGLDFMLKNGFRDDEKMYFRLDRQGQPISDILSLYTEVFASIAIAEYWKIEPSDYLKHKALQMYDLIMVRLGQPTDTPMLGYPLNAEFHLHAHDMVRLTVAWVYNDIWPNKKYEDDINLSWMSIVDKHWKPEQKVLFENVAMDGSIMLDFPEGRLFHPGHAIESGWMLMEVAEKNNNVKLMSTAIDIILASLKHGWDEEYGGLRYLTNYDWTPTHNLEADLKLWWPHGETLYALLFAWAVTGRTDIKEWYEKVHDYTFSKFPDKKHGEWYGYLNREGSSVWTAKANGWKGFFHTPRILFRSYQLLNI
ncbi:MAG: AGE family epimerase/isomerase [Flavobacteriaceae bacterium]|nr:AGE family epimerase/isomerase [Flavobacteriaceae bacterium]